MRDFVSDALIYFIGRAIPAAIGFVGVLIFVRLLGDAGYGSYAILFSGANLVSVVVVGWLSQGVLRFQAAAHKEEPFGHALSISLWWVAGVALLLSAAVPLVGDIGPHNFEAMAVTGLLAVGLSAHAVYAASLQAALRARAVAALEVARAVAALPLSLAGVFLVEPAFLGAVLGAAISYALSSLYAHRLSRRSIPQGTDKAAAGRLARQLFQFGWPISVWLGVTLFMPFAERVLIDRFLGTASTGQYAAMYDLVFRSSAFVLMPIVLAVHPRIMSEHRRSAANGVRRLWGVALLIQSAVALVVTLSLALLARQVVRATGLMESADLLHLVLPLAAAGCIWQVALVAQKLLEAEQRTRTMLMLLLVALILNITLDIIFLPAYGLVAAAYSLLLAGVFYTVAAGVLGFSIRPPAREQAE